MTELIITEKPAAAKRIADALADKHAVRESYQKVVPYYRLSHKGKQIIVACAVGHLYGLAEKEKNGWKYPVFEIEWKPAADVKKASAFSRKYLMALKKISQEADEFTIATDYDVEGEVIGLNIIRYVCNKKDANRMKFSTLTKEDLIEAYEHKSKTLDWPQAKAGETRHFLDFYYGINLSRALTAAIKTTGMFKVMSTGRVQGPTLKLIVDREKEILAFKPVPFWQLELVGEENKKQVSALHEKDKFWEKAEAERIYTKVKDEKTAKIDDVSKKEIQQAPPNPFDLTSLQIEAYRCLRISPKQTLAIAQELYTAGLISYPRTSSQKLPDKIGYKKILSALSKIFPEEIKLLSFKKELKPNEGQKSDPAHPAIYPTGIISKKLDRDSSNLYELIARRFLATFGDPAIRQSMNVKINCKNEIFIAKGITTLKPGWHKLYGRFVMLKEEELPELKKGQSILVKKITLHSKETQPPKRYTPASIIKELEKRNLGTKSTRANIIDTLFQRDYITGKAIQATDIGIKTIETLSKYSPGIVDEALTRHFEEETDRIYEKKTNEGDVLKKAREVLLKILDEFRKKEKQIGEGLGKATKEARKKESTFGKCPICGEGELVTKRGKFGLFIACTKYPDCNATYKLPTGALTKPTDKVCEQCKHPIVMVIRAGKRPQELCLNANCPSKQIKTDKEGKICPKCKKGKLVLRKSVYGSFLGCDQYPKCRYIEKL